MIHDGDLQGFNDGDRVRDIRDGSLGTVRFLELTPAEYESGECALAKVRWGRLVRADRAGG